jgi:hypothetical protein
MTAARTSGKWAGPAAALLMQRSLDFALFNEDKSCLLNGLIREPIQSMVRVEGFVVEIDRSGDKNGAH